MQVRKKPADQYSVSANYYVDMVSRASIDVVSTASPYKEQRDQASLALDVLNLFGDLIRLVLTRAYGDPPR